MLCCYVDLIELISVEGIVTIMFLINMIPDFQL